MICCRSPHLKGSITQPNFPKFLLVRLCCSILYVSQKSVKCSLHFGIIILFHSRAQKKRELVE